MKKIKTKKDKDIYEKQGWVKVGDRMYKHPDLDDSIWDIGKSDDSVDYAKLNKEYELYLQKIIENYLCPFLSPQTVGGFGESRYLKTR